MALGPGAAGSDEPPEPLASVIEYLGDDLDNREFVPTAELVEALDVEPTMFAKQMTELGCRPTRYRVLGDDGETRRVRGYLVADIRTAMDGVESDEIGSPAGGSR
jgi:S-DNA-T family DNA segregation ATPase FtsK/SpoIIIE